MLKGEAHVVHLVPALFGPQGVVGGAERYALELARQMANEVPTTLVTFGPEDAVEQDQSLRLHVIGNPWYVKGQRNNPISRRLFSALRPATIVHCHQQHVLASSLAAVFCRLTRRRVFVTDLGGGGWDVSGFVSTDRWYHGHLHISKYSLRVFGHENHPRAHVILGGVDTEKFSPDSAVVRKGDVLYVGRILPHKGLNYLIQALPRDMGLEIIGPPDDQSFLKDLKELARGKQVSFRHDVDDDALVRAYRTALCIVLPSVYETMYGRRTSVPELLGQTLLEGMACGAPTVCTDVASLPEVVQDGVTGFAVPPNDPEALREKFEWLRDHPADTRAMGEAGRRRVLERFTWPAVVRRCFDAYAGEMQTGSPASART